MPGEREGRSGRRGVKLKPRRRQRCDQRSESQAPTDDRARKRQPTPLNAEQQRPLVGGRCVEGETCGGGRNDVQGQRQPFVADLRHQAVVARRQLRREGQGAGERAGSRRDVTGEWRLAGPIGPVQLELAGRRGVRQRQGAVGHVAAGEPAHLDTLAGFVAGTVSEKQTRIGGRSGGCRAQGPIAAHHRRGIAFRHSEQRRVAGGTAERLHPRTVGLGQPTTNGGSATVERDGYAAERCACRPGRPDQRIAGALAQHQSGR